MTELTNRPAPAAPQHPASALVRDPRFDRIRATADFRDIVRRAEERQREAFEAFRAADGPRLLGLPSV